MSFDVLIFIILATALVAYKYGVYMESSFYSNILRINTKDKPYLMQQLHEDKINFLFKMLENFKKEDLVLIKKDEDNKSEQELFVDYLKLTTKMFEEYIFLKDNPFTSPKAYKAFEIGIAKYGVDKVKSVAKHLKADGAINELEFVMLEMSVPYALRLIKFTNKDT